MAVSIRSTPTASLAFVQFNVTVADAKRTMDQAENCQDVFVTQTGTREGRLLGWLTNVDISRLME